VQNPDIHPIFGKPTRTPGRAKKEDVSRETRTYGNPMKDYTLFMHLLIAHLFVCAHFWRSLYEHLLKERRQMDLLTGWLRLHSIVTFFFVLRWCKHSFYYLLREC